jgi:hypothetical protein
MTYDSADGFDDIEDLFDFLDGYAFENFRAEFGDDSDKLISALQLPGFVENPPQVAEVPRKFRNIGYGEITTTHPSRAREGLANLNQDMIYPQLRGIPSGVSGRPALAQYDRQGNVILRVLSDNQRRVEWQGTIGRIQVPRTRDKGRRDQLIEDRVRQLVATTTGQTFRPHSASGRGADLVAVPPPAAMRRLQRPARRSAPSRARRGTRHFDAFDDLLEDGDLDMASAPQPRDACEHARQMLARARHGVTINERAFEVAARRGDWARAADAGLRADRARVAVQRWEAEVARACGSQGPYR